MKQGSRAQNPDVLHERYVNMRDTKTNKKYQCKTSETWRHDSKRKVFFSLTKTPCFC